MDVFPRGPMDWSLDVLPRGPMELNLDVFPRDPLNLDMLPKGLSKLEGIIRTDVCGPFTLIPAK